MPTLELLDRDAFGGSPVSNHLAEGIAMGAGFTHQNLQCLLALQSSHKKSMAQSKPRMSMSRA